MLPALLTILSLALGASASSCASPKGRIEIDRAAISGRWWIQVQYGIPPVTDSRCYNAELSVNSKNRLNELEHWKVGDKWTTVSTPEITPQHEDVKKSRTHYFQLPDGVETVWFLQLDYNKSFAVYGCKNNKESVLLIATKEHRRNETLVNEITKAVAKLVPLPEGRHVIDQTDC